MRDNRHVMTKFVKIVERYPVIYDRRVDTSRPRQMDLAWEKIAESVRNEINEECSVEELRVKWKGIRSSYGRYKNKLIQSSNGKSACKKYYLYDTLQYLEPFSVCGKGKRSDQSESIYEESSTFIDVDETEDSSDDNTEDWSNLDIKQEVLNKEDSFVIDVEKRSNNGSHKDSDSDNEKKIKISSENIVVDDDDDKNLHFFKSILPDIRGFTIKEKRTLKMGILKLIDNIENERPSKN